MIIGLTGAYAAGKDTVANYLQNQGFDYYSCSDIIREECRRLGQETNRENLIKMGNKLRKKYGDGYLAQKILRKIRSRNKKNALVVSIRHPKEVEELKKEPTFLLVAVDAPLETRFIRIQQRQGRAEDKDTFSEFKKHEEEERKGSGHGQQLDRVIKMADFVIINDRTKEELYKKIDEILAKLNLKNSKD